MGRKFEFTLEPVLELRRRAEEAQQRVVAQIEQERVAVEARIRTYQEAIASTKHELRAQLAADEALPGDPLATGGKAVPIRGVRMQANASLHLIARAQAAVLELAGVHKRLGVARSELLRRAAERKAVEMLREKRYEEWRRAEAKAEQDELDELAVMRMAREERVA